MTQDVERKENKPPAIHHPVNRFDIDLRRILPLCLLGGVVFWLTSVAEALFSGSLNVAECLGSLWLFVVAALALCLILRLLVGLTRPLERYLVRTRWLGSLLITAAAAYPLADLLLTRRSWAVEFFLVSLVVVGVLFALVFFGWRYASLKSVWLVGSLFSAWFFYNVVENEGLILRAGVDLLDLPTLVLFLVTLGTAATGFLITRFAQSLSGRSPLRIEAAASLLGGLFLAFFAADAIDVHYENIFQVTLFFAFLATLHGLSWLRPNPPLVWSLPPVALLLVVGAVLVAPIDEKPGWMSIVHAELGMKNRAVEEIFKLTGLAEGQQRVAICRLHKIAPYPEGEFSERFRKSVARSGYRPSVDELRTNPARPVLSTQRPWNFLLITVDSLRYDRGGYSGLIDTKQTPTMSALAQQSQRFHRAYPQGAWTSLAIPSLMWSKLPSKIRFTPVYEDRKLNLYLKNELTDDVVVRSVYQVPLREKGPNLPGEFEEAGYSTIAVLNDGNTGFFAPRLGLSKGFETVHYTGEDGRDIKAVELVDSALRDVGETPFLMWVHLFDVHKCYKKPTDREQRRIWSDYDYRISVVDGYIGTILERLEKTGLADSTVVILTGDHGESFGELGVRGHGLGINNASIHVPLLIRIPGLDPADYYRPVGLIDLAPTMMDLAGHGEWMPKSWTGTSLAPMLVAGKDIDHPPVLVETWRRRLKSQRKRLYRVGVMYDEVKVTLFFNRMEPGFYDVSNLCPTKEKPLFPSLNPAQMRDDHLHMFKYIMDWKERDMARRCQ